MFTASAELYDAIYFTFKDYAAEAADIAQRIHAPHPGARTVLDVACGTGEHARLLATDHGFEVDGLDLNEEFLRLARLKHPAGRFHAADMTSFDLGRRYDAVICLFSSVGYVQTLPVLERTLARFRRHTQPDGVIIVEPWFAPGKLQQGYHSTHSADGPGVHVDRVGSTDIDGRLCHLRFDYTITREGGVEQISEVHDLGLFTVDETLRAFASAGLAARHEAPTEGNRGLYIARVAA